MLSPEMFRRVAPVRTTFFGGTYILRHQGGKIRRNNVVSSTLNLATVMMEVIRSSDTSLLTIATRGNILEEGFFIYLACIVIDSL
jgi:hypothetical protein